MSKLKIKGLVSSIKSRTNVYTPIIEAIVNSIQSIDNSKTTNGEIIITVTRSSQAPLQLDNGSLPDIESVSIQDNGIGFNDTNRNSFDTLYSELKLKEGGKGFGRFMFLKYFDSVNVNSIYKNDNKYYCRKFNLGKDEEIIENETNNAVNSNVSSTIVNLEHIKTKSLEKKLDTLARKLLEKLLIFFINDNYICPKIILKEADQKGEIVLNDYLENSERAEIQQVANIDFELTKKDILEKFQVKIFKIFYANSQKSKISLTAHNREVTETPLHNYVPEFEDDFYEESISTKDKKVKKDYIIKAYVLGKYLDSHVSLDREDFDFSLLNNLLLPFSQEEIERKTAEIAKEKFINEVKIRSDKKREKINEYVKNAPWHKDYIEDLDISSIPYSLTDEIIEIELHKVEFQQERSAKVQINKLLDNSDSEITVAVEKLVDQISKAERNKLTQYIALRKTILNLFKRSLAIQEGGKYCSESAVHNIIFPTRANTDTTRYSEHNLWIIDENLTFTEFISSDQPTNGGNSERTDLLIFNQKMAFRGDNEASNPISIFEFKKPQRDDFVNKSSKEDPVQQIIRYVNNIKDGKFKTPEGRDILIGQNTPFYGFVICDLTKKVTDWLAREKDFKQMPDGKGWFQWFSNNNLYIEVISWDKLLNDAEMRNKVFFHKLGIE